MTRSRITPTILGSVLQFLAALSACGGGDPPLDEDGGPDLGVEVDSGAEDSGTRDDIGTERDANLDFGSTDLGSGDLGVDSGTPDAGPPDLGPPPSCTSEGATRLGVCGYCGMRQETCTTGVWVGTSTCLGSRSCAPASLGTETTPMCGERTRLCGLDCEWGSWEQTMPDRECATGVTRTTADVCGVGTSRTDTCSATCDWTPGTCGTACGGTRRTAPSDAEEICIPPGDFIRGGAACPPHTYHRCPSPPVTVTLTRAYYIDRYPVTNRRYQECAAAGGCGVLYHPSGRTSLADATRANYPVQGATLAQANAFCAWDGDRRIPTSAEWERSARGPAPLDEPYVWPGTAYRCDLLPSNSECGDALEFSSLAAQQVDAYPLARSHYGVDGLIGVIQQWVSDRYTPGYHLDPLSLVDPTGPATGTRQLRSWVSDLALDRYTGTAYVIYEYDGSTAGYRFGFRCARTAPLP